VVDDQTITAVTPGGNGVQDLMILDAFNPTFKRGAFTFSDAPPATLPNSVGLFSSSGDLTYSVATKATGTVPQAFVTWRNKGTTEANANCKAGTTFQCGDATWTFSPGSGNTMNVTGTIKGQTIIHGFWQF
jgi:hypothetical protein